MPTVEPPPPPPPPLPVLKAMVQLTRPATPLLNTPSARPEPPLPPLPPFALVIVFASKIVPPLAKLTVPPPAIAARKAGSVQFVTTPPAPAAGGRSSGAARTHATQMTGSSSMRVNAHLYVDLLTGPKPLTGFDWRARPFIIQNPRSLHASPAARSRAIERPKV